MCFVALMQFRFCIVDFFLHWSYEFVAPIAVNPGSECVSALICSKGVMIWAVLMVPYILYECVKSDVFIEENVRF